MVARLPWVARYRRAWLGPDVVAGVATAAVVLPQAMAYASIAGLPVQYGLYVATVPMVVYAVLGTSRPLSVSTTSTVAALTATAIAGAGSPAEAVVAATTLACLAGAVLVLAGFLRLGYLADFISAPVLAGFKVGTALVIIAGQLGKVLGVPVVGDNFFEKVRSALSQLDDANGATVLLAAATMAVLLALRRFAPRIPGALVGVVGGILVVAVLDLVTRGVTLVRRCRPACPARAPRRRPRVRPAPRGVRRGPDGLRRVDRVGPGVPAPRRRVVSPDRELVALGAAGLAGGLFQSLPAAGGLSQTAVNDGNGARSPVAGAVTGVFGMLTLLFLTPLFADLADATLGAVVLVAVVGLLDTTTLRAIALIRRRDFLLAVAAVFGILLFGVLGGVLVAVLISIAVLLHGANVLPLRTIGLHPDGTFVPTERGGDALPSVLVVRPEGPLYFANIGRITRRIEDLLEVDPTVRVLVIDGSAIPDVETTAAMGIAAFELRLAAERDVTLHLAALTRAPRRCSSPPASADRPPALHATLAAALLASGAGGESPPEG